MSLFSNIFYFGYLPAGVLAYLLEVKFNQDMGATWDDLPLIDHIASLSAKVLTGWFSLMIVVVSTYDMRREIRRLEKMS